MTENFKVLDMLNVSPSVDLLRLRNKEIVIGFLINTFLSEQGEISTENIHNQLADFLEYKQVENDEDSEITLFDTYE